ncbi:hypothetical protein pb186bvf_008456 [Paramecium bursaria]
MRIYRNLITIKNKITLMNFHIPQMGIFIFFFLSIGTYGFETVTQGEIVTIQLSQLFSDYDEASQYSIEQNQYATIINHIQLIESGQVDLKAIDTLKDALQPESNIPLNLYYYVSMQDLYQSSSSQGAQSSLPNFKPAANFDKVTYCYDLDFIQVYYDISYQVDIIVDCSNYNSLTNLLENKFIIYSKTGEWKYYDSVNPLQYNSVSKRQLYYDNILKYVYRGYPLNGVDSESPTAIEIYKQANDEFKLALLVDQKYLRGILKDDQFQFNMVKFVFNQQLYILDFGGTLLVFEEVNNQVLKLTNKYKLADLALDMDVEPLIDEYALITYQYLYFYRIQHKVEESVKLEEQIYVQGEVHITYQYILVRIEDKIYLYQKYPLKMIEVIQVQGLLKLLVDRQLDQFTVFTQSEAKRYKLNRLHYVKIQNKFDDQIKVTFKVTQLAVDNQQTSIQFDAFMTNMNSQLIAVDEKQQLFQYKVTQRLEVQFLGQKYKGPNIVISQDKADLVELDIGLHRDIINTPEFKDILGIHLFDNDGDTFFVAYYRSLVVSIYLCDKSIEDDFTKRCPFFGELPGFTKFLLYNGAIWASNSDIRIAILDTQFSLSIWEYQAKTKQLELIYRQIDPRADQIITRLFLSEDYIFILKPLYGIEGIYVRRSQPKEIFNFKKSQFDAVGVDFHQPELYVNQFSRAYLFLKQEDILYIFTYDVGIVSCRAQIDVSDINTNLKIVILYNRIVLIGKDKDNTLIGRVYLGTADHYFYKQSDLPFYGVEIEDFTLWSGYYSNDFIVQVKNKDKNILLYYDISLGIHSSFVRQMQLPDDDNIKFSYFDSYIYFISQKGQLFQEFYSSNIAQIQTDLDQIPYYSKLTIPLTVQNPEVKIQTQTTVEVINQYINIQIDKKQVEIIQDKLLKLTDNCVDTGNQWYKGIVTKFNLDLDFVYVKEPLNEIQSYNAKDIVIQILQVGNTLYTLYKNNVGFKVQGQKEYLSLYQDNGYSQFVVYNKSLHLIKDTTDKIDVLQLKDNQFVFKKSYQSIENIKYIQLSNNYIIVINNEQIQLILLENDNTIKYPPISYIFDNPQFVDDEGQLYLFSQLNSFIILQKFIIKEKESFELKEIIRFNILETYQKLNLYIPSGGFISNYKVIYFYQNPDQKDHYSLVLFLQNPSGQADYVLEYLLQTQQDQLKIVSQELDYMLTSFADWDKSKIQLTDDFIFLFYNQFQYYGLIQMFSFPEVKQKTIPLLPVASRYYVYENDQTQVAQYDDNIIVYLEAQNQFSENKYIMNPQICSKGEREDVIFVMELMNYYDSQQVMFHQTSYKIEKSSLTWLWITLVILGAIIIIGGGFGLFCPQELDIAKRLCLVFDNAHSNEKKNILFQNNNYIKKYMGTIQIVENLPPNRPQIDQIKYQQDHDGNQFDNQSLKNQSEGPHHKWISNFNLNGYNSKDGLEEIKIYSQSHNLTIEELLFEEQLIYQIDVKNNIQFIIYLISQDTVKRKINLDSIGQILLNEIFQISQDFTIFELLNKIPEQILRIALEQLEQADVKITYSILSKRRKLIKQLYEKYQTYNLEWLKQVYKEFKQGQNFDNLNFKKKNGQLKQNIILKNLEWNIFHEIAQQQKWDLFIQQCNELYFTPNNNHITPFHIFLSKAPIQLIIQFSLQYQQIDWNKQLKQKNYIHSLCENKNLEHQHIEQLLRILTDQQQQQFLHIPYQDMIPLVYYLSQCKIVNQEFINYLSTGLKTQFNHEKLTLLGRKFTQTQMDRKKIFKGSQQYFKKASSDEITKELTQEVVQEFQEFYLYNVQLAKILIKRKFDVDFDWIIWFSYSNYVPYEAPGSYLTEILATQGLYDKLFLVLQNQINLKINKQDPILKTREYIAIQIYKVLDHYNDKTYDVIQNQLFKLSKELPISNYLDIKIPDSSLQEELGFMLANPQTQRYFDKLAFMNIIKNCFYDNDDTGNHKSPYFTKLLKLMGWKLHLYQEESSTVSIDLKWIPKDVGSEYLHINLQQTLQIIRHFKIFEDIFSKRKEDVTYEQSETKQIKIFNFYKYACENQSYQWLFDKLKNYRKRRITLSQSIFKTLIYNEIPNSVEILNKIKKSIHYDIEIKTYSKAQFDRLFYLTQQTTTLIDRVQKLYLKTKKKSFRFKYIAMYNKGMDKFFDGKTTRFYDSYGITQNHIIKSVIRGGRDNIDNMIMKTDVKDDDSIFNFNQIMEKFTRQIIKIKYNFNDKKQSKWLYKTKYFLNSTQEQEEYINENLQYLWKIILKYGKQEDIYKFYQAKDENKLKEVNEDIWEDYTYLNIIFRYLNKESLDLIGDNLIQMVKQQFKQFPNLYQTCQYQFQKDRLIEIYFKLFENSYPKFLDKLNLIISSDKNAAQKIFQGLYKYADKRISIRNYLQPILFRNLQNEEESFEYIEKVGLTSRQVSRLFQLYYMNGKIHSIYKLLYYQQKLNIEFKINSIGRFIRNQQIHGNLFKAIKFHYSIVLNSKELSEMRQIIQFDQEQIDQCAILTIYNGLIDNYKLFMDNKLNQYQQIYAILRNVRNSGITGKQIHLQDHFNDIEDQYIQLQVAQEEKLKQEQKDEIQKKIQEQKILQEQKELEEKSIKDQQQQLEQQVQSQQSQIQSEQINEAQNSQSKVVEQQQMEQQQAQQQEGGQLASQQPAEQAAEQQAPEQQAVEQQAVEQDAEQQAIEQQPEVEDKDIYKPQPIKKGFENINKIISVFYLSNNNNQRKYFISSDIHFMNNNGPKQNFQQALQFFLDQIDTTKDDYVYLDKMFWLKFIVKYQRDIKSEMFLYKALSLLCYRQSNLDKDLIISALIDKYKNSYREDDLKEMQNLMYKFPAQGMKLFLSIKNADDDSDTYKTFLPGMILSKRLKTQEALDYLNQKLAVTDVRGITKYVVYLGKNGVKPIIEGTYQISRDLEFKQRIIDKILIYKYHPGFKYLKFNQVCALMGYEQELSHEDNSIKFGLISYNINLIIQAVDHFKSQTKQLKISLQSESQDYKQQKQVVIQVFYYLVLNFTQDSIIKYFDRFIAKKSYKVWLQLDNHNLLNNLIFKKAQYVIKHIFINHLEKKYGQQIQQDIFNQQIQYDNSKEYLLKYGYYYIFDFYTPTYEELLNCLKTPKFIDLQQNFNSYQGVKSKECHLLYQIINNYLELQYHNKRRNYSLIVYSQLERCCFGAIFNLKVEEKFNHILLQIIFGDNSSDEILKQIVKQSNYLRFYLYYLGFNQDHLDEQIKNDIDLIKKHINKPKSEVDDKILYQIKDLLLKQTNIKLSIIEPLFEIKPTIFNNNLDLMVQNLDLGLEYIFTLDWKGQLTQQLINQLYQAHLNNTTLKSEGICSILFLIINILTNDFSKQLEIVPTLKLINKTLEFIKQSKFFIIKHINQEQWINFIKPHFNILNEHQAGNNILVSCLEQLQELIRLNKIRHQNSELDTWIIQQEQNIEVIELVKNLNTKYPDYNFDSLKELKNLNNIDQLDIEWLLEKQPQVGFYKIDDVFAPHKHEQVKKLEPALMRRSSSIMHNQVMGYQRQQSALTESFNFMLELLPDNTYQVKNRKQSNQREIIFLEFYNFILPKVELRTFQLTQEEFNSQYTNMTILDFLMDDLTKYQDFIYSNMSIAENEYIWNIDFPVYYDGENYKFRKELFSTYSIQKLQNMISDFITRVKQNTRKEKETSKINWRINIHSFLETFVVRLVEQYGEQRDIFQIVRELLNWETLVILLYQIIYHNFTDAQQILKVLRGIYIEFQDSDQVEGIDLPGLDQIFTFGEIKYQLYNQMMIIKIGVGIKEKVEQPKQLSLLDQEIQLQHYIFNIVNKYDLFLQIFNPEQIVQFIFNKYEKDKQMQVISKKLSKIYRKDFTLGIDHQSLAKAFYKKIYTSKHQSLLDRLQLMSENAKILFSIDNFFENLIFQYIQDEFESYKIQEAFQFRLYTILNALRYKISFDEMIKYNKRKVTPQSQLIKQSIFRLRFCKYTYLFGFHLNKDYQIQTLKLGQIFSVFVADDDKETHLIEGQYVGKNKNSDFIFFKLGKNRKPLKLSVIVEKQQQFNQSEDLDSEYPIYKIDNLLLIIKYMKKWPQDPNFNKNIQNIFLVDSHNYVHLVKQSEFKEVLLAISSQSDDHRRQDMLDKTFGKGIVNSLNEISLTQMNPVIPEIINFEFVSKENDVKQFQDKDTFKIVLDNNTFEILSLQTLNFNVATQVDMCLQTQKILRPFRKSLESFKELQNNEIVYDNSLNNISDIFMTLLNQQENILNVFLSAYKQYLSVSALPRLENSMAYLLDLSGLSSQKRKLFKNLIKKIQFHYVMSDQYENEELIQFKDNCLNLLIKVDVIQQQLHQPTDYQILQALQKQIINQLIVENQRISIKFQISSDAYNLFISLCLGLQSLLKYFDILNLSQNIQIQVIRSQIEDFYTIYEDKLIFNIDKFQDIFIDHITLDFLNQGIYKKTNFQYIGEPYLALGELNQDIRKLIQIPDKFEDQIQVYQNGKQIIFDNNKIELQVETPQKVFIVLGEKQNDKIVLRQIEVLIVGNQILNLQHLIEKKSAIIKNQRVTLLGTNIQVNKSIHEQIRPIFEFLEKGKDVTKVGLQEAKQAKHIKFDYKLISKNYLMMTFQNDEYDTIKITFDADKQNEILFQGGEKLKEISLSYSSILEVDITKTVHILRSVGDFQNEEGEEQNYKLIKYKTKDSKYETSNSYEKLLLSLVKSNLKSQSIKRLDKTQISAEPLTQDQINLNILSNLYRKQRNKCTRAGEKRFDYLEFKDTEDSYSSKFNIENAIYVHRIFNNVTYVPIIHKVTYKEKEMIALEWEPTVKGIYDLYLNETFISKCEFVVIASTISHDVSKLEYQFNQEKVNFFERIKFTFNARDKYNNPYSVTEQDIKGEFDYTIKSADDQLQLDYETESLNELGQWKVQIWFKSEDVELLNKQEVTEAFIDFTLLQEQKLIQVNLQGISRGFKVTKFVSILIDKMDLDREEFTFRRANFLEDLLKLKDKNLRCKNRIYFEDEPGIDAGGLRREFFDLVGQTIKDENYKFFISSPVDMDKYFWHPSFKNKEQANLFGRIFANSIINELRIGIEFIVPFWKVILDEPIVFDDLKYILDDQTLKNYELLRTIDPSILELDFTISEDGETVELIENGKNIAVTAENVNEYLQKLTDYYLRDRHKQAFDGFREGMFEKMIDKELLQKWISSEDLYILTLGDQVLSADSILEKTYIDGPNIQQQFWKRYVSELSQKELKQVLKFITGSSSIPVEKSDYKIKIEFYDRDVNQLPMSHTCYQSMEVPKYPTFIMLKQKMDLALSVGLEGFGFEQFVERGIAKEIFLYKENIIQNYQFFQLLQLQMVSFQIPCIQLV